MGKVTATIMLSNLDDLFEVEKGQRSTDYVRSIEVSDALVDTGATMLSLPTGMIQSLGLKKFRSRTARTPAGIREFDVYGMVRLDIEGRDCSVEVAELPDECPVLIGQVPLELLDFVVDPQGQRLIGNPDHGGKHMIEMF